jgi:hypothetical protein
VLRFRVEQEEWAQYVKSISTTSIVALSHLLIKKSKRKISNVQGLTHLGHEHQAPDHEATQPMMGYEPIHKLRLDHIYKLAYCAIAL